jgi:hypothetical protein
MAPEPMSFEDREYVLRIVKEREKVILAEVEAQRERLAKLTDDYGELSEGLRGGFDELRDGFDRLTHAVLQHVQAESEADRTRDALVREHSVSLAVLATSAGGSAGATAGRGAGARWGGLVSALVAGALLAIAKLLGVD